MVILILQSFTFLEKLIEADIRGSIKIEKREKILSRRKSGNAKEKNCGGKVVKQNYKGSNLFSHNFLPVESQCILKEAHLLISYS